MMKHIRVNKSQQGFTLIELMIVIAIVGILAAVALPAYVDYTIRSRISGPLGFAAEGKTTVAEYYSARGTFPASTGAAGLDANTKTDAVSAITYYQDANGDPAIIVVVKGSVFNQTTGTNDRAFYLSGTSQGEREVLWKCKPCETAAECDNTTAVWDISDQKWLPASCRT
jgi:type IV pilus assembly protein PilA